MGQVVRLQPSGKDVDVERGDTVLAALERAGYALPNNCRAGACGECKTRVISGEFAQGMVLSMALSDAERAEGLGLMCMAVPLTDVLEIEFGTADAMPNLFPPRTDVPFVVVDKLTRTPSIVELRIRPIGAPLKYWPGQYLLIGKATNGVGTRCYSIANAPRPDGEIRLLITQVEGGSVSGWIHEQVNPGDRLAASGPYGTFIGDPAVQTPVVCLAAGSGLAPILALTDAALRRGFRHPVTLVFSARSVDDEIDTGMLRWWEAQHPNFTAIVTSTGPSPAPDHRVGRIPAVLPELFPTLAATSVFIAGSPEFVADCAAAAANLGASPDLIHTEGFVDQTLTQVSH